MVVSGFLVISLLLFAPIECENTTTEVTVKKDIATTSDTIIVAGNEADDQQPQQRRQRQLMMNSTTTLDNRTELGGFVPSVNFQLGPVLNPAGPIIDIPRLNETEATTSTARSANRTRLRSPFNTLGTIKFENGQIEQKNDKKLPPEPPFRPSDQVGTFVKFMDDDQSTRQYTEEEISGTKSPSSTSNVGEGYIEPVYHHSYQIDHDQVTTYAPEVSYANGHQQYVAYETKPLTYQDSYSPLVHHHHHTIVPTDVNPHYPQYQTTNHLSSHQQSGTDEKPEMVINVHPISYQATSYDMLTKPKTVIYVTTHDETPKTRKYPYNLQPQAYDHQEVAAAASGPEEHLYPLTYEPHPKSISPWKKILHVIGAFLPLGLLFALLSPKVISYDQPGINSGGGGVDPGIVLSKLRVDDLPAEHKTTTNPKAATPCEERLVCRLLAAAEDSPAGSSILRELLRQITDRTAESAVRKKELDKIFEAAKMGNCDILTCNFYDGT